MKKILFIILLLSTSFVYSQYPAKFIKMPDTIVNFTENVTPGDIVSILGDSTLYLIKNNIYTEDDNMWDVINADDAVDVGLLTATTYARVGAFVRLDSTLTTAVGVDTWVFLGEGNNSQFTNIYNKGFGFIADTLQYTADETIFLHIEYGGTVMCNTASENVTLGLFINDVEAPQLTGCTFCKTAGESYPIAGISNIIQVSTNDKIKIMIKSSSATTVTNEYFSISSFKIF